MPPAACTKECFPRNGKSTDPWDRPDKTPHPDTAAFPAARATPFNLPITEAESDEHRQVGPCRAAAAWTETFEALVLFKEVAEGQQSGWIGVHGGSMMRERVRG